MVDVAGSTGAEAERELGTRTGLGEAWNEDEVVWNGIEVGIRA